MVFTVNYIYYKKSFVTPIFIILTVLLERNERARKQKTRKFIYNSIINSWINFALLV